MTATSAVSRPTTGTASGVEAGGAEAGEVESGEVESGDVPVGEVETSDAAAGEGVSRPPGPEARGQDADPDSSDEIPLTGGLLPLPTLPPRR